MEYSSAFCSAGWLRKRQSLGFELGVRGQAGWHCKASTLGQVSSFHETHVTSCYLRFLWIVSLNSGGYWDQHLLWVQRVEQVLQQSVRYQWRGHQHLGIGREAVMSQQLRWDVLFSGWIARPWTSCRFWMSAFSHAKLCCCFDWHGS